MADALADAVAQAEAELAAQPERIWIALRTTKTNKVLVLGATYSKSKAIELCKENAKASLTWTAHDRNPSHAQTSEYVRVVIKKEYNDVRYTILNTLVFQW